MARINVKTARISLLGILIHVIFLYSIFDIYFKSPVLHGMPWYAVPLVPAPARRLVLIVADGLRADRFFELKSDHQSRAPFLRNVLTNKGVWGVSHTRVPTESRPGHVALIAGLYEDVSAVAKGWKENPVEFDSVFNQSRFTWGWGSPDIVSMFAKGAAASHVFAETYDAGDEDFAGAMPSKLDEWVFQKFREFLHSARQNSTLAKMLQEDKIIFFLHLLGLDTNGHAHNPASQDYLQNINLVDRGVEMCVNLLEDYYDHDEKTAYIFTSDHGMTDWGTHGASHRDETHTPIVAWGAGIRQPLGAGHERYHDGLSEAWNLTSIHRVDVHQADVAPLMATLLGIPFPVNSVGVLPIEYLSTTWRHRFTALKTNAKQILAQYDKKVDEIKETSLIFRQFREFSYARHRELKSMMDVLAVQKRYQDASQVCLRIIELALKGLDYYQKYDRFILKLAIVFSYFGWMCYLILVICESYTSILSETSLERRACASEHEEPSPTKARLLFVMLVLGVTVAGLLQSLSSPTMYFVYFLMPVYLWSLVISKLDVLERLYSFLHHGDNWLLACGIGILGFIGTEILVGSFFRRWFLSFGLMCIAAWPLSNNLWATVKVPSIAWMVACGILALFPLLPVVGRESNYHLVGVAGWLSIFVASLCARRPEAALFGRTRSPTSNIRPSFMIFIIQIFLLWLSMYNVISTADSIAMKAGLPLLNQLISWAILLLSFILPLLGSSGMLLRLLHVTVSLLSVYILMCVSYEGLFSLSLVILMVLWIYLEHEATGLHKKLETFTFASAAGPFSQQQLRVGDFRRAYFFMFFIVLAFFGTGNIASINSFEPGSVYCFLTVFSPFTMGALMLIKIMIPFLLISCFFRALLIIVRIPHQAIILICLLLSDVMGLHFFFLVQDFGSWLDIGTSISHYVIAMAMTIFMLMLHGLAWVLTSHKLHIPFILSKQHWY